MKKLIYTLIPAMMIGLASPAMPVEIENYDIITKQQGTQEKIIQSLELELVEVTYKEKIAVETILDNYFGKENKHIEEDISVRGTQHSLKETIDYSFFLKNSNEYQWDHPHVESTATLTYKSFNQTQSELYLNLELGGNNESKIIMQIAKKLKIKLPPELTLE